LRFGANLNSDPNKVASPSEHVSAVRADGSMKAMEAQKAIPMVFSRLATENRIATLAMTAPRFLGLGVGDWSIILLGIRIGKFDAGACLIQQLHHGSNALLAVSS
jgi:hypothetical protein